MGNTASTERGPSNRQKNEKLTVKPPEDWNAYTEAQKFVVVSPQSDLSNPSQFRHHHNRKPGTTGKTPIRRRASKVISNGVPNPHYPPMTSTLPAPEAFYFDPNHSSGTEQLFSLSSSSNKQQNQQRDLHKTVKYKASRARKLLKGCWKEQKEVFEGCIVRSSCNEKPVGHERLKSMSTSADAALRRNTQSQWKSHHEVDIQHVGKARGPQFIPEVDFYHEEIQQRSLSPRQVYIHDEESYINRMVEISDDAGFNETPMLERQGQNIRSAVYPLEDSITGGDPSPVAKLFAKRPYSDSGLIQTKTEQVNVQPPARQSYPEIKIRREPNTVERNIQRQIDAQLPRPTLASHEERQEEKREQDKSNILEFQSKSEEIGRVRRLRESYLQKLEESKRLSLEEAQQRKIAEREGGSKKITRAQTVVSNPVQDHTVKEGDEEKPFDEALDLSKPVVAPYDEAKENHHFQSRGRSSAPIQSSTNGVGVADKKAMAAKQSRKSEPAGLKKERIVREEPLPVLLKIAGWEQATKKSYSQQEPQLPALLQLAGWKQTAYQKTKKLSIHDKNTGKPKEAPRLVADLAPTNHRTVESTQVIDSQKEQSEMNRTSSKELLDADESREDVKQIPLPYKLQSEPKDTPVVKKMSRMLLETHAIASVFDGQERRTRDGALVKTEELSQSFDSISTPMSVSGAPLLARDALVNAAFLFSPSYVENDASVLRVGVVETRKETSTSISTLDSRNRVLTSSYPVRVEPVNIRPKKSVTRSSYSVSSTSRSSISTKMQVDKPNIERDVQQQSTRSSTKSRPSIVSRSSAISDRSMSSSDRHVRFSIGNQVIVSSAQKEHKSRTTVEAKSPLKSDKLVVPGIEQKMSDLTDVFESGRESVPSLESHQTIPTVDEEDEQGGNNDETPTLPKGVEEENEEESPPTHWSYSADFDNGVTPLRSGKGGGEASNRTNSPYKRFNEAKNKFAGKKSSPVKRNSPVKPHMAKTRQSGSLVQARVAAMEKTQSAIPNQQPKSRRDSTAHKAIAPRKANLKSPYFRQQDATKEKFQRDEALKMPSPSHTKRLLATSSVLNTGKDGINNFMQHFTKAGANDQEASSSDSESKCDNFGAIRQTRTYDEEDKRDAREIARDVFRAQSSVSIASRSSASTDFSVDEDDFAAILQYQTSTDEGDSAGENTMVTLQRSRSSVGSVASGATAPTLLRRTPTDENSVMSGSTAPTIVRCTSTLSGATEPTSLQNDKVGVVSSSSYNTRSTYPYGNQLRFREGALVRPTEQSHRAAPGALVLSPMQRTPMQALKWRALAAAAHEKTGRNGTSAANSKRLPPRRQSLAERNPNLTEH